MFGLIIFCLPLQILFGIIISTIHTFFWDFSLLQDFQKPTKDTQKSMLHAFSLLSIAYQFLSFSSFGYIYIIFFQLQMLLRVQGMQNCNKHFLTMHCKESNNFVATLRSSKNGDRSLPEVCSIVSNSYGWQIWVLSRSWLLFQILCLNCTKFIF